MGATIEEIAAKLDAAAEPDSGKSESSTDVEKETVTAEAEEKTEDTPKKGKGAKDRIQELVSVNKELEAKLAEINSKFAEKEAEVGKLIDLVQDRESDSRIVAKLNDLHRDPKFTDMIETLDKAIRGVEVEIAKPAPAAKASDAPPQPGVDLLKIQNQVQKTTEETKFQLEDQRTELLLMKSELVAEKLFGQLPETEYNAEDRNIINRMFMDTVDWEAIEENPNILETAVAEGFQRAINEYGTPKGQLEARAGSERNSAEGGKSKAPVDLSKLDLGKLKTERVGNKDVVKPVLSDNDFAAILAEELRRSKGR